MTLLVLCFVAGSIFGSLSLIEWAVLRIARVILGKSSTRESVPKL